MIGHYTKTTKRVFLRDQTYTWINLLGLIIAMFGSITIFQYARFEQSFDSFHEDYQHKFRIIQSSFRAGEFNFNTTQTPHKLGSEAEEKIPGIKGMVRIRPMYSDEGVVVSSQDQTKKFLEFGIWYVDDGFLDMFTFPLALGNPETALADQQNIILTAETAQKHFGKKSPIGQIVRVHGGSISGEFTVTGVLEKLPANSHMNFDYLIPINFLLSHYGLYVRGDGWGWTNFHTYLHLEKNTDKKLVSDRLKELLYEHWGEDMEQSDEALTMDLQRIDAVHLHTYFANDLDEKNGSMKNIWLFQIVGVIILLIAWINYVNLTSAKALKRFKEIRIRKTIGAAKSQLATQFFIESLIFNTVAFFLALIPTFLLLPDVGDLMGKELQFSLFHSVGFWLSAFFVIVAGSLISSLYPTFIALSWGTGTRDHIGSTYNNGSAFRKSLIVVQLSISLILTLATYLIYQQVIFMREKELGIAMDQILVVEGPRAFLDDGRELLPIKHERFKNSLLSDPNIHAITGTTNIPGTGEVWWGGMRKLGVPRDHEKDGRAVLVDRFFTDAYQFDFLAGGPFTPDLKDYEAVIINEEAVKVFELGSPNEAIGEHIIMTNLDTLRIHGVVKNVNWNSLHEPIAPTIYGIVDLYNAYLSIRLSTGNLSGSLASIEAHFREIYPKDPYNAYFLDSRFNQQYQSEQQFGKLFGAFTILAVVISILGLFSLVAFSISFRIKEIGIRKVLGAKRDQLILLLSREYFWLLAISTGISIPLFILGGSQWLDSFAYHISISWKLVLIPVIVLVVIAILSVFFRIYRATLINPVNQLRNE